MVQTFFMHVNSIYSTFQGEVNRFGIGSPAIFLRLQGCHLRCYKRTMGILCDTPEALEKPKEEDDINGIIEKCVEERKRTGIKVITLTGGDPLWNDKGELMKLLAGLVDKAFYVNIETSGTIDWLPYTDISYKITLILDYKLKSAGIKNAGDLFLKNSLLKSLHTEDFIKFVIYNLDDVEECIKVVDELAGKTKATLAVGAYWGGKLSTFDIFKIFEERKMLDRVVINMQAHKMAVSSNFNTSIPEKI